MTDYRRLDPVRRDAEPLQLDLVEAFVQGRVSRRELIRRGSVLGLSLGTIGAIIIWASSTAYSRLEVRGRQAAAIDSRRKGLVFVDDLPGSVAQFEPERHRHPYVSRVAIGPLSDHSH